MYICNKKSCESYGDKKLCKHGVPHHKVMREGLNTCDYPCNAGTPDKPDFARCIIQK